MPQVRLLDKEVAELIAAGEVIERPSSVIKELVENSIDSGAAAITIEIKRGGISYIRVTDNGCAMSYEDVPVAFKRHATSKLADKDQLSHIMTLGFRGEALASVCAVARCEVLTKPKGEEFGTHYIIEGTEERLYERSGCPDGTTIIIRDIFYNVPARLKFLKKDTYEGNAIASIVGKIAVSHPEISFRFIRDNNQELFTPGDSRLYSAIYSVFGKEYAASMIPVNYRMGGISVSGYTVKPLWGRKNRSMQHFYVNGRYIKSLVCMGALEEAYRNNIMEGKFPACVIFMNISPAIVDVNVHPAKTEVRFSDDKTVYDALYFAVKNAILADEKPAELVIPEHKRTEADYAPPVFRDPEPAVQTSIDVTENKAMFSDSTAVPDKVKDRVCETVQQRSADTVPVQRAAPVKTEHKTDISAHLQTGYGGTASEGSLDSFVPEEKSEFKYINKNSFSKAVDGVIPQPEKEKPFFRIIGEAFKNYIIAETEEGLIIADKHAAHERIRFERLRSGREELTAQQLLIPCELTLAHEEYDALVKNLSICTDHGFDIEPLQAPRVRVKGIPSMLDSNDAGDIVTEVAKNFADHRHDPLPEMLDDMYHTMACKGAIKANDKTDIKELEYLLGEVLADERIKYCPHGRPVMFRLTKKELEKQFRRIV